MHISVFKRTNDNWYPSYHIPGPDIDLVEVSLIESDGVFIVCAWGGDDCGVERLFNQLGPAQKMFDDIISWDHVDRSDLFMHDFKSV
jgi:hypothetical protein